MLSGFLYDPDKESFSFDFMGIKLVSVKSGGERITQRVGDGNAEGVVLIQQPGEYLLIFNRIIGACTVYEVASGFECRPNIFKNPLLSFFAQL